MTRRDDPCWTKTLLLVLTALVSSSSTGSDVTPHTSLSFCGHENISCSVSSTSLEEALRTGHTAHQTTTDTTTHATDTSWSPSAPRNASSGVPGVRFCGVPDDPQDLNRTRSERVKRYSAQGKKWSKKHLTWALRRSSSRADLPEGVIRQQLTAAMLVWQRESTLVFQEVHKDTKDVDIIIDFVTGDHGDGYKFDGRGGTLAHAFYPGGGIGGDMHFDDTENFVTHLDAKKYVSNSLLVTAAHELGHSLGLLHSDDSTALMAPYYQVFPEDFRLPDDDRYGIQALYGRPRSSYPSTTEQPVQPSTQPPYIPPTRVTTRPPYIPPTRPSTRPPYIPPTRPSTRPPYKPPTRPPRPPPKPTLPPPTRPPARPPTTPPTPPPATPEPPSYPCPKDPPNPAVTDICATEFDSAAVYRDDLYFFRDEFYWCVTREGRPCVRQFPYRIKYRFHGLPRRVKRIDGVYVDRRDNLIFFSGPNYFVLDYRFRLRREGVLADLGVNATHVDAVMVWGRNGRTYLFSGDQYWRLDRQNMAEMDYPRDVNVWRGLPHNLSAAFTFDTITYFFAGRVFWEFNNTAMRATRSPYLAASHWLSCPYYDLRQAIRCASRSPSRFAPSPPLVAALALLAMAAHGDRVSIMCNR
ncbi:matrix metalloproteinase-2-like [Penaeus japonicus]|uniref:matrix metalloproteinase-2-like n=1 Tax=Penaeus japonicus TaxID=27405 RepID=UPI001C717918|nr:matrix metalloproteinase-2-like [Penaeus japonicus]